jgi:predicted nucleic acid-binding Zn ribbon protein
MTGDFLPRRRQASVRIQLLTVLLLIAAAVVVIYLLS